jgi:universal stress protein A
VFTKDHVPLKNCSAIGNPRVAAERDPPQVGLQRKAKNMKTITKTRRSHRAVTPRTTNRVAPANSFPTQVRSILVPIDFSAPSVKALDYAVALAGQFGAKLALLNVIEPIATPDFAYYPLVMENDKIVANAKKHLEQVCAKAGIETELIEKILVRNGAPFREITDAARTLKADLIVISTHGYSGLAHVFMGSTAERVVRHAECPVLVVRGRPEKSK